MENLSFPARSDPAHAAALGPQLLPQFPSRRRSPAGLLEHTHCSQQADEVGTAVSVFHARTLGPRAARKVSRDGQIWDFNLGCPAAGPPLTAITWRCLPPACHAGQALPGLLHTLSSVHSTPLPTPLLDDFSSPFGCPRGHLSRAVDTATLLRPCPSSVSVTAPCSFPRSLPYHLLTHNCICTFWYVFITCSDRPAVPSAGVLAAGGDGMSPSCCHPAWPRDALWPAHAP